MRVAAILPAPTWPTIPPAVIALVFPLALLALWFISARFGWLPPQILPSPGEVWAALLDTAHNGDLARNTGISLLRVVEGFAAGSFLGMLLGIAMGLSPKTEDYVKPLFTAFAQVPTLGWIPFLMLLVGIGEPLKVLVIAKPLSFRSR
jgi:sulfonate transport system permease protein